MYQKHIKSILRSLAIISDIITVLGVAINLNGFSIKSILENPYTHVLFYSLIFTGIVFLIPIVNKKLPRFFERFIIYSLSITLIFIIILVWNATTPKVSSIPKKELTLQKNFTNKKTDTSAAVFKKDTSKHLLKSHLKRPLKRGYIKNVDTSKGGKYVFNAPVSQSAIGDHSKVENYNGIKPRHLDSAMYFNLMKRVEQFWKEHPKAERNLITVSASPDKDSRQLASEIVYELKKHGVKVSQDAVAITPMQSDTGENFEVEVSLNNKDVMIVVLEQQNVQ